MEPMEKASLDSQLGNAPCTVEDTEEMFWLRESDDFQSRVALGNALAGQYRFRDAIAAYRPCGSVMMTGWCIAAWPAPISPSGVFRRQGRAIHVLWS